MQTLGVPCRTGPYCCPDDPSRLGLPAALVQAGISAAGSIIGGLDKGSKGPYPLVGQGNATDQARAARAESYLIGAALGSVLSARLALGARQRVGATTEKALYDHIIQEMAAVAPSTLAQARTLGTADDAGDGRQGLAELLRLNQGFSAPWAGHAGADHSVLDQSSVDLANKLHELDVQHGTNTMTLADVPGVASVAGVTAPPVSGGGGGATGQGTGTGAPGAQQAGMFGGGAGTLLLLGAGLYAVTKVLGH